LWDLDALDRQEKEEAEEEKKQEQKQEKQEKEKQLQTGRQEVKQEATQEADEDGWVQCSSCDKWRKIPSHAVAGLADVWTCAENRWEQDTSRRNCDEPEVQWATSGSAGMDEKVGSRMLRNEKPLHRLSHH
jgi:hypothetical protein